jgi:electron transfer flavoprotein beta subunit
LKIVVGIKQVPDSAAKVGVEGGKVTWGDAPLVLNPWDEYAVEAALVQADNLGADVTAITVGGESAKDVLKTALAMGAREAVLISDPALESADSQAIAHVLAAAIRKIGDVELAFFGRQAIDSDTGVVAAQTGRVLGWPVLSLAAAIQSVANGVIRAERSFEEGRQVVEAKLPAVVSVGKDIGEPRYPSFMGIRKASKAVIPTWSLSDLALPAPQTNVQILQVSNPPVRQVTTEMITGATVQETAEKLVDKILGEKVL